MAIAIFIFVYALHNVQNMKFSTPKTKQDQFISFFLKSFHCIFRSCIYQFIAIFVSNIFHATEHRFQLVCSNGTKKNCQNSPSLRLQLTFFIMIDVDHWILVAYIMQSIWNEKKTKISRIYARRASEPVLLMENSSKTMKWRLNSMCDFAFLIVITMITFLCIYSTLH